MRRLWLLCALFLLFSCSGDTGTYPQRIMPAGLASNTNLLDIAKQTFLTRCADCHGTLSEGRISRADFFEPAAPDFKAPSFQQKDPAYLFWRISQGKMVEPYLSQGSVMPAWGAHLGEEEIWGLVAYLQSRSKR